MSNFHKPIRMCVVCKNRFLQAKLNRFISKNAQISAWEQGFRSFYICDKCIQKDQKDLAKILSRLVKFKGELCLKLVK